MLDLETILKTRVRQEEGWRAKVYDDKTGQPIRPGSRVVGHPTIGWGFAVDVADIPKEVAELWLSILVARVHRDLIARIPFWSELDPVRQLALAEMAYQMGVDGLLKFKHALQALATGDAERAAAEFMNSVWSKQIGDGWGGRPDRAERVCRMVKTGRMPEES